MVENPIPISLVIPPPEAEEVTEPAKDSDAVLPEDPEFFDQEKAVQNEATDFSFYGYDRRKHDYTFSTGVMKSLRDILSLVTHDSISQSGLETKEISPEVYRASRDSILRQMISSIIGRVADETVALVSEDQTVNAIVSSAVSLLSQNSVDFLMKLFESMSSEDAFDWALKRVGPMAEDDEVYSLLKKTYGEAYEKCELPDFVPVIDFANRKSILCANKKARELGVEDKLGIDVEKSENVHPSILKNDIPDIFQNASSDIFKDSNSDVLDNDNSSEDQCDLEDDLLKKNDTIQDIENQPNVQPEEVLIQDQPKTDNERKKSIKVSPKENSNSRVTLNSRK